jgi:hypothetical protein
MLSFIEKCTVLTQGTINLTKYAIILQGPYYKEYTKDVIQIFLDRNPEVAIIVSTYLYCVDQEQLDTHHGRLLYLFVKLPSPEEEPEFWRTNTRNQNCQILTSSIGLNYAKKIGIPFALKMRSDAFLGMPNVCQYLQNILSIHPPILLEKPRLNGRILVLDYCMIREENLSVFDYGFHNITDFMFFGHTEDLIQYFNARDDSVWNKGRGIKTGVFAECNISELWMEQVGIPSDTHLSELFGRYFAVASNLIVELWLKVWQPDLQRYLKEGKSYLEERHKRTWGKQVHITSQRWDELVELTLSRQ